MSTWGEMKAQRPQAAQPPPRHFLQVFLHIFLLKLFLQINYIQDFIQHFLQYFLHLEENMEEKSGGNIGGNFHRRFPPKISSRISSEIFLLKFPPFEIGRNLKSLEEILEESYLGGGAPPKNFLQILKILEETSPATRNRRACVAV